MVAHVALYQNFLFMAESIVWMVLVLFRSAMYQYGCCFHLLAVMEVNAHVSPYPNP